MKAKLFKEKLNKKTPLLMSPFGFALAACGGGGGGSSANSTNITSSTPIYGSRITTREMENNNTLSTANYVSQQTFTGQSYSKNDSDYFFVNAPDWRVFDVSFQSDHWGDHQVTILDSDGIGVASTEITKSGVVSADPYVQGGIYIWIFNDGYDDDDYTITISQGSGVYENEPNNFQRDADVITADIPIRGQSFSSSDDDYFTFTAYASVSTLNFSSDHWGEHTITVLDAAGNTMVIKEITKSGEISTSTSLGSDYVILVEGDGYDDETYTLTLESPTADYYNSLFYDDFDDIRWENNVNQEPYTFGFATLENKHLWTKFELMNVREFTSNEKAIVIEAMSDWGEALPEVQFVPSNGDILPDIFFCVGSTSLANADGQWNSYFTLPDRIVTNSLIRFEESKNIDFRKVALHEIGNVLGLGDIRPDNNFVSVMEDPIPNYYPSSGLSEFDFNMITTIYNHVGDLQIIT
jgi:hypothetical protein